MSEAKLEAVAANRIRVSGVLDAVTAPRLLEQSEQQFPRAAGLSLEIDFGGVAESDSAGLALALEWVRVARQRQQTVKFENLPRQIVALARISEVEALLRPDAREAERA